MSNEKKISDAKGFQGNAASESGPGSTLQSSAETGERISAAIPIAPAHTPGPWFADGAFHAKDLDALCSNLVLVKDSKGYDVAYAAFCRVDGDNAAQVANARLMAAAPDMLDCLRSIRPTVYAAVCADNSCLSRRDLDRIDDAIKLATANS